MAESRSNSHSYIWGGMTYYFERLRNISIDNQVRCGISDRIGITQETTEWQRTNDLKKSRVVVF